MRKRFRIRVQVLALDIRFGYRNCGGACPLALAIHRALGYAVDVGPEHVFEYNECFSRKDGPGRRIAALPPRAQEFLEAFDRNRRQAKPFGFCLDVAAKDAMGERR